MGGGKKRSRLAYLSNLNAIGNLRRNFLWFQSWVWLQSDVREMCALFLLSADRLVIETEQWASPETK